MSLYNGNEKIAVIACILSMDVFSLKTNRCQSIQSAVEARESISWSLTENVWNCFIAVVVCIVTKLHYNISQCLLAAISKISTKYRRGEYLLLLLLVLFKGLWESWVLSSFPFSLWVPLCDRLMSRPAGPLPKSISSTWHVSPHRQRVPASESSMFLKFSLQGIRAYSHHWREAAGFTFLGEKILWTAQAKKQQKNNSVSETR